jgi:hypothetical protein
LTLLLLLLLLLLRETCWWHQLWLSICKCGEAEVCDI